MKTHKYKNKRVRIRALSTTTTILSKIVTTPLKEALKLNLFKIKLTKLLNGLSITIICDHSTNPVTLDLPQKYKLLLL